MAVTAIDVHVDNVSGAIEFLHQAYGWPITCDDPNFGELVSGDLRVMLSAQAAVPWGPVGGVILHEAVDDVAKAVRRAVDAGADLILGPVTTGWGTETAFLRGPGNLVVEVFEDVAPVW